MILNGLFGPRNISWISGEEAEDWVQPHGQWFKSFGHRSSGELPGWQEDSLCYHSYGREEVMLFMAPQGEDSQKLHTFPDLDSLCLFLWRVLIWIPNFNKYDYQCHSFQGDFPNGNPPAKAGDMDSIPGTERSLGRGNSNLVQYFCLRNPIDRGAWWAIVQRVLKSWTEWLSKHIIAFSEFQVLLPNFETCGWFWETHWVSEILARLSLEDCLIQNSSETNSIDYSQMIWLDTEKNYINWQIIIWVSLAKYMGSWSM